MGAVCVEEGGGGPGCARDVAPEHGRGLVARVRSATAHSSPPGHRVCTRTEAAPLARHPERDPAAGSSPAPAASAQSLQNVRVCVSL